MEMLTSDAAARILSVSRATILQYIKRGWLSGTRLPPRAAGYPGQWRIPMQSVQLLLRRCYSSERVETSDGTGPRAVARR